MTKVTNTPRPYLSWSQLTMVLNDPKRYRRIYILGDETAKLNSPALSKGSALHKRMETGDECEDLDVEIAAKLLPKLAKGMKREQTVMAKVVGVPLLGIFDGFNSKTLELMELKTSRQPWTQKKVDTWGQITMYAAIIYAKYNKLPKKITLYNALTAATEDGPKLTGEINKFETSRTLKDILEFAPFIAMAWKTIIAMTEAEYSKAGLNL